MAGAAVSTTISGTLIDIREAFIVLTDPTCIMSPPGMQVEDPRRAPSGVRTQVIAAHIARCQASEKTVRAPVSVLTAGTDLTSSRSPLTWNTRSCVLPFHDSFQEISGR
jgi:hypothetical protein